jgi:hypothetical protein
MVMSFKEKSKRAMELMSSKKLKIIDKKGVGACMLKKSRIVIRTCND